MNDIRKIAVGPDYKTGAMHYVVGQEVLGGSHVIHLIKINSENKRVGIFVQNKKGEIFLWKDFSDMPLSIEYNIYFE